MPAPKRRIIKAMPRFLSLCPKGMNGMQTMFKSDTDDKGQFSVHTLVKGDDLEEKGELLAVVYAPERTDSEGDIASVEVIDDMMKYAAREGGLKLDMVHNEKPLTSDQVYLAESFIIQKSDQRFHNWPTYEGDKVDVTGAWGVRLQVDCPVLRKAYKDGEWSGVSLGGTMLTQQQKNEPDIGHIDRILKWLSDKVSPTTGDSDMTPEQMAEVLSKSNASLTEGIVKGVVSGVCAAMGKADPLATPAPAPPTATPEVPTETKAKKDEAPVFDGDPHNIEEVTAHKAALDAHRLRKTIDWNDPVAVDKHMSTISVGEAAMNKAAGIQDTDSDEVKGLKRDKYISDQRLEKAMRASGQGSGDASTPTDMNKAEQEAASIARMSKHINGTLGTHTGGALPPGTKLQIVA